MKEFKTGVSIRWNIILVALLGSLLVLPPSWGEPSESREISVQLESTLKDMIMKEVPSSNDPNQLLLLASLYLDLGYGVYVDKEKKIATFREGAKIAKKALDIQESLVEGHFLYAANLGSAAELEGIMSSVLTIQELQNHIHRVLELDPHHVPAHHMLGRIYEELPWFLGGNQEKAGQYLQRAVVLDGLYAPGRLDLAKWYLKQGETEKAESELIYIVNTPPREKKWVWERRQRPEAQALLQHIISQRVSNHHDEPESPK